MPIIPKSKSPNVVFWNPRFPSTGSNNAGIKVINNPFINEPIIAPFLPPVELPYIPAVAPQKKCGTNPGIIKTPPTAPSINIPIIPPIKLDTNPITTAV